MCERCGDERCNDPDSKWCSDILLMRYRAERDEALADARSWERQNDDRVTDVLTQADRAEKAEAERDALRADWERLCSTLIHLEQAYSNRHSPQHRAAALNEAQCAIAARKEGK